MRAGIFSSSLSYPPQLLAFAQHVNVDSYLSAAFARYRTYSWACRHARCESARREPHTRGG